MDENTKKKIYAALAAPFPEEAIERTDGKVTGKGYSTTGIKYQYVVNRVNEVLGFGSFRAHRTITVKEITRGNGRPAFEALCDLSVELGSWENGQWVPFAEALADGGHVSSSEADARKGAFTNALKKGFAMFGVGREAYQGSIDDDALPSDPDTSPMTTVVRAPAPVRAVATTPPAAPRTQPQGADRGRISSKQVAAIMSISRKLGTDPAALRSRVKTQFNCQLEFLSREQASTVITSLQSQLNSNGSGHHSDPPAESLAS